MFFKTVNAEGEVTSLYEGDSPGSLAQPVSREEYISLGGVPKSKCLSEMDILVATNALNDAKIQALTDRNEFLEDCIAEMAMFVYQ